MKSNFKIAVVGLGYVGLPLAVEFGKKYSVIGFDKNPNRIKELLNGFDQTNELTKKELERVKDNLHYTSDESNLSKCNIFIVTVPTPVDANNKPDCSFIENASSLVGNYLKQGDIVIFESTVYPGATREICIPILERVSNLSFNKDFFVGYSPERINPGDKARSLTEITKVVSGSNEESTTVINNLYASIINAGTHIVSSIEVAEAAKVIENTQRDLNIALVNELSLIFNKIGIDTKEVIDAAGTKWNFAKFYPGFVGGHCIGVDPYYLTYKAQSIGYDPQVILSGRNLNDSMPKIISKKLQEELQDSNSAEVLILGYTFKEDCPDIRNTKIKDLAYEIVKFSRVTIYDPYVDHAMVSIDKANIEFVNNLKSEKKYDVAIIAVGHKQFIDMGPNLIKQSIKNDGKLWDLKSIFKISDSDFRL